MIFLTYNDIWKKKKKNRFMDLWNLLFFNRLSYILLSCVVVIAYLRIQIISLAKLAIIRDVKNSYETSILHDSVCMEAFL